MSKLGRQAVEKISSKEMPPNDVASALPVQSDIDISESSQGLNETANGVAIRADSSPADRDPVSAPDLHPREVVGSNPPASLPNGWEAQCVASDNNRNALDNWVCDYFLLDSIPNLVYPEAGVINGVFDDVSQFDGFGMVI